MSTTARCACTLLPVFCLAVTHSGCSPINGEEGEGAPPAMEVASVLQTQQGPMPLALLSNLAEAVEGYQTGNPVWVVALPDSPYHVAGVFPDSALADSVATSGGFEWYGPFVAPRPAGFTRTETYLFGCVHVSHSWLECPWILREAGPRLPTIDKIPVSQIDTLRFTLFGTFEQSPLVVDYVVEEEDGEKKLPIDAIIFNHEAYKKFAHLYCVTNESPAECHAKWQAMIDYLNQP